MATRLDNTNLRVFPGPVFPGIVNSRSVISTTLHRTAQAAELGSAFGNLFAMLWRPLINLQASIERARTVNELTVMNDRMLADIGIRREELPLIASGQETSRDVEKAADRYFASLT